MQAWNITIRNRNQLMHVRWDWHVSVNNTKKIWIVEAQQDYEKILFPDLKNTGLLGEQLTFSNRMISSFQDFRTKLDDQTIRMQEDLDNWG